MPRRTCAVRQLLSKILVRNRRLELNPVMTGVKCHESSELRRASRRSFYASRRMSSNGQRSGQISWRQPTDGISLGRAKADSPSPRNGSQYPVSQIGSRNIPRVLQTGDGECLDRVSTMVSFTEEGRRCSGGFVIAIGAARDEGNPPSHKTGRSSTTFAGTASGQR